ncbi:MAG: inositol monophosphatase [Ilumatobacter sp.]|nr:inositol monophosphatase [Ilumatobacter sp.]
MPPPPAHHLEHVAIDVVRAAAALVREHTGRATTAATKTSPTDVVTHTDLASETLIRRELEARCPGSSIVGEEYGEGDGSNRVGWVVDPIDGTVNFLYDLPVVAISIAATIDGEVVAGAVADVQRGEVFSASAGRGARRDGEPVSASRAVDIGQSLVGTGFSYDAEHRASHADTVATLLAHCRDIRCMGSAALNLCWVGCGRLDAHVERDLKRYDFAAGALIAAEGGATVREPSDDDDLLIAAAPGVASELAVLATKR